MTATASVTGSAPVTSTGTRRPWLDATRGMALLAMAVYHACWDASFFGLARFDMLGNPIWLTARTLILASFLVIAGISLALANERSLDRGRFMSRLAKVGGAALLVSAASYATFPGSPIFFGVLHHIAVASIIAIPFLRLPWLVTLVVAMAVTIAGETLAFPAFDHPALRWIGFVTFPPDSNDFVPLLPWIGALLAGVGIGRRLSQTAATKPANSSKASLAPRSLVWLGQHSLLFYLIHQPVLIGLMWLISLGFADHTLPERTFIEQCVASCVSHGGAETVCQARCLCVRDDLTEQGVWLDFLYNRLPPESQPVVGDAVGRCSQG